MQKAVYDNTVSILIPFGSYYTNTAFTTSLTNLINYSSKNNINIENIITTERYMIHWARESLASRAVLDTTSNYFLWLDDDHVFQPDTLVRLLKYKHLPMVSALYCEKRTRQPIMPTFDRIETEEGVSYKRYELPSMQATPNSLVKVDAVGFGFLLMQRKVLESITPPYFRFKGNEGEDCYFSEKAETFGVEAYIAGDIEIGHIGEPRAIYPFHSESGRNSDPLYCPANPPK